jgi:hypothetical protein
MASPLSYAGADLSRARALRAPVWTRSGRPRISTGRSNHTVWHAHPCPCACRGACARVSRGHRARSTACTLPANACMSAWAFAAGAPIAYFPQAPPVEVGQRAAHKPQIGAPTVSQTRCEITRIGANTAHAAGPIAPLPAGRLWAGRRCRYRARSAAGCSHLRSHPESLRRTVNTSRNEKPRQSGVFP